MLTFSDQVHVWKRGSIVHSISVSPANCLNTTEILLKKDIKSQIIHPFISDIKRNYPNNNFEHYTAAVPRLGHLTSLSTRSVDYTVSATSRLCSSHCTRTHIQRFPQGLLKSVKKRLIHFRLRGFTLSLGQ